MCLNAYAPVLQRGERKEERMRGTCGASPAARAFCSSALAQEKARVMRPEARTDEWFTDEECQGDGTEVAGLLDVPWSAKSFDAGYYGCGAFKLIYDDPTDEPPLSDRFDDELDEVLGDCHGINDEWDQPKPDTGQGECDALGGQWEPYG